MKPDFYPTRLDELDAFLGKLKEGEVRAFGTSAGGRPLHVVTYGDKEEVTRTAPLSAALESGKPETFYGETARQVLMIVCTIHGGEMEGIAGAANLMNVLETGKDLKGKAWPVIAEGAGKMRFVIVPSANPDGRARIPKDDPKTWTEEEVTLFRHGRYRTGELAHWPGCKAPLPAPEEDYEYIGGYFNDARVMPDHGYFLGRELAPEPHALVELALAEHADLVLDLHSCETGPFMIVGDPCLPEPLREAEFRIDGAFRQRLRDRNLGARPWTVRTHNEIISLRQLYWHVAGAQPIIFEGPNGMWKDNIWSHEQIV
ncbi:MAG TPA: M14 family zinc carboxypeptidase, partial [Planctomycetota bacterium]|nr:M14 family zinc carboxypeptidase [Planctomycetota bacterium]